MIKQVVVAFLMLIIGLAIGRWGIGGDSSPRVITNNPLNNDYQQLNDAEQQDLFGVNFEHSNPLVTLEQKVAKVPVDIRKAIENVVNQNTQFEQYAAAYPLALEANQKQLSQMIDTIMSMESEPRSRGLVGVFYNRFIDLNPNNATAYFWQSMPESSGQYRRVLFSMYHEWAWNDMEKALEDIITNAPEKERENLLTYLLRDEHFNNNAMLIAIAQDYSERTRAAALLASAQDGDYSTAFGRILSLPNSSESRRGSLYRLVNNWAKEDPVAALARIEQMPKSSLQQSLLSSAISIWAEKDPEQALIVALNSSHHSNLGYAALSSLARSDGARAMALAEQYADRLDSNISSQLMQTWASSNAQAAANYIELKGGSALKSGARQIAWHYTMQYPDEAYQWAERVGLLDNNNVASNMGNALAQTDLSKAEALFAQLPASAARNGLFTNIVRQRSKIDIEGTYKWLSEYKDEPKFADAQSNLIFEWSRKDPQRVIEITQSIESGKNRDNFVLSAVGNWYDKSPDSAINWVFENEAGIARDRILASLAQRLSHSNIQEALELANQIDNDDMRNRTINFINR